MNKSKCIPLPDRMKLPVALLMEAEKISGRTRFQKLLFLGQKEYGLPVQHRFETYTYGPYSFDLAEDLVALESFGVIRATEDRFDSKGEYPGRLVTYELTGEGKSVAKTAFSEFSDQQQKNLKKLVSTWNNCSLNELINYVYKKYLPERVPTRC